MYYLQPQYKMLIQKKKRDVINRSFQFVSPELLQNHFPISQVFLAMLSSGICWGSIDKGKDTPNIIQRESSKSPNLTFFLLEKYLL
jgi:hypothetical protein